MSDNTYAKVIKIVGFIIIIGGIIGSFVLGGVFEKEITYPTSMYSYGSYTEYNWTLAIIGAVSSFVVGLLLIGFSETISLLQQNADNQERIIRQLKEKPSTVVRNTTNINDEQSANRSTTVKHLFRCENCGKMIEEYPCCECGFKFN